MDKLGENRRSPGGSGRTRTFVKFEVFVSKLKPRTAANPRLRTVPTDLAVTALPMPARYVGCLPSISKLLMNKRLALILSGLDSLDDSASNCGPSISSQNQEQHEGPDEPLSQSHTPTTESLLNFIERLRASTLINLGFE